MMFSGEGLTTKANETLRVAHLVKEYLPYSCSWIFHQITGPQSVETRTIAWEGRDESLRAFPNPGLDRLSRTNPLLYALTRPLTTAGIRWISRAARKALRHFSPHLGHAHFGHHAWTYLPAVKALRLPLVVSFYGHDMSELPRSKPIWRRRYSELFEYGRLFFCEGPAMASGLENLGCPAGKIRIQPLGVDCSKVSVKPRLFQPGDTLKILLAARMTEKKGIPDAIRAVAEASRQIRIHLTVVGDPAPGSKGKNEHRRILETIRETGAAGSVTLAGRVGYADLFQIADQHHVLLQPSRTSSTGDSEGGLPVSLIELGATGMPAIATRHADIPEVVEEAKTGFLADEGDTRALAAALVRMATTPGLINDMGHAMARHIAKQFDQPACHARLVQHYQEAIAR